MTSQITWKTTCTCTGKTTGYVHTIMDRFSNRQEKLSVWYEQQRYRTRGSLLHKSNIVPHPERFHTLNPTPYSWINLLLFQYMFQSSLLPSYFRFSPNIRSHDTCRIKMRHRTYPIFSRRSTSSLCSCAWTEATSGIVLYCRRTSFPV